MPAKEESEEFGAAEGIPGHLEKYLTDLQAEGRKFSRGLELQIYRKIRSEIEAERDLAIRQFMEDSLLNYIDEGAMLLSYIYENLWKERLDKERALRETIPIELYIELEKILGCQSDAYAYTKTLSSRRYPLIVPGNGPGQRKVRNLDNKTTSPSKLLESYYTFGAHRFAVGASIHHLLRFLEERYHLRFQELETRFQAEKSN